MTKKVLHLHIHLLFCLITCHGMYQGEDWVDPTDMLNYDAAANRMRHEKEDPLDEVAKKEENDSHTKHAMQELDIMVLKQQIDEYRRTEQIPQSSNPIFRRYLHRILKEAQHLGLPDVSQPEVHYDAEVVLTKEMVAEIQKFLSDGDWHVGALDEVLSSTLIGFKYHNKEEWRWGFQDYVGTDPLSALMIALSALSIVIMIATEIWTHIGWCTQIRRLCAICFVVSLPWNWMRLYRVAFAEQQAELTKMKMSDETCGREMTWFEGFLGWLKSSSSFHKDPCEEYYKSLTINPALQVTPAKVFAVTFTDFITEPLKYIGKGIGEFFHALLAEMPLFYQLPVLIIIALLLLVFFYGAGEFQRNNMQRGQLPPPEPQGPAQRWQTPRNGRAVNEHVRQESASTYRKQLKKCPVVRNPMGR